MTRGSAVPSLRPVRRLQLTASRNPLDNLLDEAAEKGS